MKHAAKEHKAASAFELKGSMLTLLVLHLYETDCDKISRQLDGKIAQAPGLFKNAPVVIDLQAVCSTAGSMDISLLVRMLRSYGIMPMGVRGGNAQQNDQALSAGLNLLPDVKSDPERRRKKAEAADEAPEPMPKAKIVTLPVRSGQQVVAAQGDLIVLSMVSPGAEVLANRHIHVYGTLRGRALAGVNGDKSARIFCQRMNAELVSIAGHYQISEDLDESLLDKPAQVFLEEDSLRIQSF
ncbi:MAG: septum site-determining protein MinC [Gammaproteobacteria bacterium]|nr:septum site-determining protein MinC [Gammaproteobacteria bacterium]